MNVDVQNLWSGDRFWSRKLSINPWPFQQALAAHVWRAKEELHLPKCILKPISELVWWRLCFLKMTWRLQEFESSVSLRVMVCQVDFRNDCSVSLFSVGADIYKNPFEVQYVPKSNGRKVLRMQVPDHLLTLLSNRHSLITLLDRPRHS